MECKLLRCKAGGVYNAAYHLLLRHDFRRAAAYALVFLAVYGVRAAGARVG